MSQKWIWRRLWQIIIDAIVLWGMFLLAYFVRVGWIFSTDFPFAPFAWSSAVATMAWSAILALAKVYRLPPRTGARRYFDVLMIMTGGVVAVGVLIVLFFFQRELVFSRLLGLYALVFGITALLISQKIFRLSLARSKRHGQGYRTLIIGANRVSERFVQQVQQDRYAPFQIRGVIDPYGLVKNFAGAKLLGKMDQLEAVTAAEKIDAIVQCDAFEHTLSLLSFCEEKDIKFQFLPSLRGVFEDNLRLREIAGIRVGSFVQRDFSGIKRTKFKLIDLLLRQVFDVD